KVDRTRVGKRRHGALHEIHDNAIDGGRRLHSVQRKAADGESVCSEITRDERGQASGDGKNRSKEEKRTPSLHPIRYLTEHHGGDASREREEREQEAEGERIPGEKKRAEGGGHGEQSVDASLSRECEGGPRSHPSQVNEV